MPNFIKLVCGLLVVVNISAQQIEEDTYRYKVRHSPDVPDGITFASLLTMIQHYIEIDRRPMAVGWMAQELNLSIEDASEFVDSAIQTAAQIESDKISEYAEIACKDGIPVAYNEDVYPILQELYAVDLHVSERYLDQMKADLAPESANLLQKWVDDSKLNTTYIEMDYAKIAENNTGFTPDLSMFCQQS